MNPDQFSGLISQYLKIRERYKTYPQLFNRCAKYWDWSEGSIVCLKKYYLLESDSAKDFVSYEEMKKLAQSYNCRWDTEIRKWLDGKLNKYLSFWLCDLPIGERPIEMAYFKGHFITALKNGGVKTVGDLLELPSVDILLDIPQIGRRGVSLIDKFIKDTREGI